jgi:hypothetical protein
MLVTFLWVNLDVFAW